MKAAPWRVPLSLCSGCGCWGRCGCWCGCSRWCGRNCWGRGRCSGAGCGCCSGACGSGFGGSRRGLGRCRFFTFFRLFLFGGIGILHLSIARACLPFQLLLITVEIAGYCSPVQLFDPVVQSVLHLGVTEPLVSVFVQNEDPAVGVVHGAEHTADGIGLITQAAGQRTEFGRKIITVAVPILDGLCRDLNHPAVFPVGRLIRHLVIAVTHVLDVVTRVIVHGLQFFHAGHAVFGVLADDFGHESVQFF